MKQPLHPIIAIAGRSHLITGLLFLVTLASPWKQFSNAVSDSYYTLIDTSDIRYSWSQPLCRSIPWFKTMEHIHPMYFIVDVVCCYRPCWDGNVSLASNNHGSGRQPICRWCISHWYPLPTRLPIQTTKGNTYYHALIRLTSIYFSLSQYDVHWIVVSMSYLSRTVFASLMYVKPWWFLSAF